MSIRTLTRWSAVILAGLVVMTASVGGAQAQRSTSTVLTLPHGAAIAHPAVPQVVPQVLPQVVRPVPDYVVGLQCREVGNGDVATTVRITHQGGFPMVPPGHNVTVYGTQGQTVHNFALPSALGPGQHVDVTVVPWQAVYQGCSATTNL